MHNQVHNKLHWSGLGDQENFPEVVIFVLKSKEATGVSNRRKWIREERSFR